MFPRARQAQVRMIFYGSGELINTNQDYELIGLPFAVALAFLQGVKRPLLAPFL